MMEDLFNNYNLSNVEIEKIIKELRPIIKTASKINGKVDEECEQIIMITLYKKLCKKKFKNF